MLSEKRGISTGVPQGSILGPLLFILYINDIPNVTNLGKFYIFADDTAVMFKADTVNELQNKVNMAMPEISKWFQVNRLSLNASKSNYQMFTRNKVENMQVKLQTVSIERKSSVRYLGMHVDENLKWHNHIAHVASKISRNLGVMGRAKFFLSSRELQLLYNALIYPYINYCAVIWGNNYDSNTKRIMLLQKRAVRIIGKKSYLHPTNELFIEHRMLKFSEVVKEQSMLILLRFINDTLPHPISQLVRLHITTRTRQVYHFAVPRALTNYKLFAFSCSAPRTWNNVMTSIFPNLEDVPRSKLSLKKHIRKYFLDEYNKL